MSTAGKAFLDTLAHNFDAQLLAIILRMGVPKNLKATV
jgi:hypothetical protein